MALAKDPKNKFPAASQTAGLSPVLPVAKGGWNVFSVGFLGIIV